MARQYSEGKRIGRQRPLTARPSLDIEEIDGGFELNYRRLKEITAEADGFDRFRHSAD